VLKYDNVEDGQYNSGTSMARNRATTGYLLEAEWRLRNDGQEDVDDAETRQTNLRSPGT